MKNGKEGKESEKEKYFFCGDRKGGKFLKKEKMIIGEDEKG